MFTTSQTFVQTTMALLNVEKQVFYVWFSFCVCSGMQKQASGAQKG